MGFIPNDEFIKIPKKIALLCVDVLTSYNCGLLLIKRKDYSMNEEYCSVGGRIPKGIPIESAIREKVKSECNHLCLD